MFRQFIAASGLGHLHLVAMVIFLLTFVAVVAHTLLDRDGRRRAERAARLPFEDGELADAEEGRAGR